jgi:hypothetical protein
MTTTRVAKPTSAPPTALARVLALRERLPGPVSLSPRSGRIGVAVISLGALAFYLAHSLLEQHRYLSTGYDLGIFDQAVRAYSHLQQPLVPLKGSGVNIFGDHFHPIIAVLAPLYWLWDSPSTLLVAQAVLIAASIPVVYRFTRRRAGEGFSLVVAGAYGAGWPVQALVDFDFHEIAFGTPILALAIDALDRRDDRRLVLWCVLLLLVREDMGILVALIGLLRWAQRRPNRPLVLGLVLGGLATYWVTTAIVIPHFAAGHGFAYGNQFGELGNSVSAAGLNVLTHPWHAVAVFFSPEIKFQTFCLLLVPLALLPLRSPYAVLALPLLAERFLNSRHNLWQPFFHYNALPWLVLVLAMVDGGGRLGLFERLATARRRLARAALGVWLLAVPLLLIPFGSHYDVLPMTKLRQGYDGQQPSWLPNARSVVAYLPADVCVAADNRIAPHLTTKDWTTVAEAPTPPPDFYVIDMSAPDTGGNPPAPKPITVLFGANDDGYRIVLTAGTFLVLRSPHYTGPSSECRPLGPGKSGPLKPEFDTD